SVIGQRADIWSIKFDISFYSDGAAHPGHFSRTLNYDLSNGREITLDELFLSSSNYLQVISDFCKADLSARDIAFDSFQTGADPKPENYKNWNLSNEGFLVITFDEYQVAPYAAGPQVVVIAFSTLQSIQNPDGILGVFAQ
ncbi:MAG TPA: RsiV family protein, partial [Anaerolineales bacterium]|nr:RsiV family protein [Anaerolineales bacterium]